MGAWVFVEVCLCWYEVTSFRYLMVSLLVSFCGTLDAVIRFPASHDFSSAFTLKQGACVMSKSFCCAMGFISLQDNIVIFFVVHALNVWGIPMLYLIALPVNPSEFLGHEEDDVDTLIKMWQMVSSPRERHRFVMNCRCGWRRYLAVASEYSPLVRDVFGTSAQARPSERARAKV